MKDTESQEKARNLAAGLISTARWEDPLPDQGATAILVTRYRPRGLPKGLETWKEWQAVLAPSKDLHAAAYGIGGRTVPIPWEVYKKRYLAEMRGEAARGAIGKLARRVAGGERIMLLCSSACTRESRCHRSLLKELIVLQAERGGGGGAGVA